MPRNRTTEHKTGGRVTPSPWLSDAARRRALNTVAKLDDELVRESRDIVRQLSALRSEYRRNLKALMGAAGARRYRALRKELADASRAQRIRASQALLSDIGFNRERADRLRKQYLAQTSKLLRVRDVHIPPGSIVVDHHCTPPVTYTAPYDGFFWSFSWHRSDEASDPVLTRYLDMATGECGSAIQTRLSGADDDDDVGVDFLTALRVWHTAQATGPLEGYIAFEFNTSTYSGSVSDEWGFSSATFSQLARASLRVIGVDGPIDTQESRIFNFIDTDWGDGASWSDFVAMPRDIHWYYFRTETSFTQGSSLLLEAGVRNMTWYFADDESIKTADDLNFRLERIVVRTCP